MTESRIAVAMRRIERGKLKGFADVTLSSELGEITIKDFKVFQNEGEEPHVAFPTTSYVKNGTPTYKPLFDASPSLARQISQAILSQYSASA
jgi:hypothetical protein